MFLLPIIMLLLQLPFIDYCEQVSMIADSLFDHSVHLGVYAY